MRQTMNQAPKHTQQPSSIFGLRYLEEEELSRADVVGCYGIVGMPDPTTVASVTIKLDGCGGDTDLDS